MPPGVALETTERRKEVVEGELENKENKEARTECVTPGNTREVQPETITTNSHEKGDHDLA